LTFNGHKIHYNKEWCQQVEGHRNCVVHGPLNLINMLDFWRDVHKTAPRRIKYRATNPLYVDEPYRMVMDAEVNGVSEVRLVDSYGILSMKGVIER
jgi:hydroxyacyl-ACP dehydratase HTD2-like protein with hotdog domain